MGFVGKENVKAIRAFFQSPTWIINGGAAIDAYVLTAAWPTMFGNNPRWVLPEWWTIFWISWWLHAIAYGWFWLIIKPKYLSKLRHLPEPTEGRSWWFGYGFKTFQGGNGEGPAEWTESLKHDGIFRFLGLFNRERVVMASPEALAEVTTRVNDFIQPVHIAFIAGQILGPGIVVVNGDEHKRQRKYLQPSFAMKHIRAVQSIYWEKAVESTEKMMEHVAVTANSPPDGYSAKIEIGELATQTALDIISKAALGLDFHAISDPQSELNRTYRMLFEPTRLFQLLSVAKFVVPEWIVDRLPLQHNVNIRAAVKNMRGCLRETLRDKRERYARGELDDPDTLSALIRDQNKILEEEELITQMTTILGAGHETVSVAMSWVMYELCRNPEWQEKVRAEVRAKLPSPAQTATGAVDVPDASLIEIENMPILRAVCEETLRYWPSIPMAMRTCRVDTTVQGVFIPATTKVILSMTGTNRNRKLWGPDSHTWNPTRFYNEETGVFDATGGVTSKYGNLSFIHGGRDCIGRNFAKNEMMNVIACWVGRFQWELSDVKDMDEKRVPLSGGSFSSKPLHGVWIKAKTVPGW